MLGADILKRVLAKLSLKNWQALSQACRACRQLLAESQPILQALVQVGRLYMCWWPMRALC